MSKEDMSDDKAPKIEAELKVLTNIAVAAVEQMAASKDCPVSPALARRLLRDINNLKTKQ